MTDQLTLTIPAPTGLNRQGKPTPLWLNTNDRSHWTRRARLARQWRALALLMARQAKLPTGLEHAHITATIHKTRAGRWDAHNLTPTVKHAIDGLVDYGLLEDDDNTRLTGPDMRAGEPRTEACIILTITPGAAAMRAMEYEPVKCRCEPMLEGSLVPWCLIHGTQVEPTKKLTDAECAAEYWRAEHHYLRFEDGDPGQYKAVTQAETWHRFATHPHADEVEQ